MQRLDANASELVITIGKSGGVHGVVSAGGHPDQAIVTITPAGFASDSRLAFQTDSDGQYAASLLPPGSYDITAALENGIAGGASRRVHATVTITSGQTVEQSFDIAAKTLVVVKPVLPAGVADDRISTVEAAMWKGDRAIGGAAEMRAAVKASGPDADDLLFGGNNRLDPIQFHDRDAGHYTMCVDVRLKDPEAIAFHCVPFDLASTDDVREIAVPLAIPAN
jgi:hypothetical protein